MYECNTGNSRMNEILNRRVIEPFWLGWGVLGTEVEPVGDGMGGKGNSGEVGECGWFFAAAKPSGPRKGRVVVGVDVGGEQFVRT